MANCIFLNDDFVPEEKALLHFKDLSFQRGYGIFDFFRLVGTEPLFLNDHLDRFYFSASKMRLPVPFKKTEVKELVTNLIKRNNSISAGIRLSLTGGYTEGGYSIGNPNFVISQHAFPLPSAEQREKGIRLITYAHQRQLPHIKTIDYLTAIWLQPMVKEKGADEILYFQNGCVSECPRSNFFIVTKKNTLVTPVSNVLGGITRMKLIEAAKEEFIVEEREVYLTEIEQAKEAFITSTTKQILPVVQIDDVVLNQPSISKRLQQLFCSTYTC